MHGTADDARLPGPGELLLDQANAQHLSELAPEELWIFARDFDWFVVLRGVDEVAEIKHRHGRWNSLGLRKNFRYGPSGAGRPHMILHTTAAPVPTAFSSSCLTLLIPTMAAATCGWRSAHRIEYCTAVSFSAAAVSLICAALASASRY